MPDLIHDFIAHSASVTPRATALLFNDQSVNYAELWRGVEAFAAGLQSADIAPGDRVVVYLPKQFETVYSLFGTAAAGACFVPANPLLKARQLVHLLNDSGARVLVSSWHRLPQLQPVLAQCPHLETVVLTDEPGDSAVTDSAQRIVDYAEFCAASKTGEAHRRIDADMAAILYTSGSTGLPKGVVLSHRNLVAGAQSVTQYLANTADDRLLAVLPLSFDAGLSQLTTAFACGASAVLLDYLMPRDVIRAVARHAVTGITAVPPLWNQLRDLPWPAEAAQTLRYISNTGGAMPVSTTRALQAALPTTDIVLMYGLTEAFRSTYLAPDQLDSRPDSIGKAIPNADILVVDSSGRVCGPNEPGELVHRGALVSLGYWRDPERTARRFRPAPTVPGEIPTTELAVWSGDRVRRDEQGYLYFIGREDEMIKTSGYRVSPAEVEEIVLESGRAEQAVALGLQHDTLGQAILVLVTATADCEDSDKLGAELHAYCRSQMPNYMVPAAILVQSELPQNANGKIDRKLLLNEYHSYFDEESQ